MKKHTIKNFSAILLIILVVNLFILSFSTFVFAEGEINPEAITSNIGGYVQGSGLIASETFNSSAVALNNYAGSQPLGWNGNWVASSSESTTNSSKGTMLTWPGINETNHSNARIQNGNLSRELKNILYVGNQEIWMSFLVIPDNTSAGRIQNLKFFLGSQNIMTLCLRADTGNTNSPSSIYLIDELTSNTSNVAEGKNRATNCILLNCVGNTVNLWVNPVIAAIDLNTPSVTFELEKNIEFNKITFVPNGSGMNIDHIRMAYNYNSVIGTTVAGLGTYGYFGQILSTPVFTNQNGTVITTIGDATSVTAKVDINYSEEEPLRSATLLIAAYDASNTLLHLDYDEAADISTRTDTGMIASLDVPEGTVKIKAFVLTGFNRLAPIDDCYNSIPQ